MAEYYCYDDHIVLHSVYPGVYHVAISLLFKLANAFQNKQKTEDTENCMMTSI